MKNKFKLQPKVVITISVIIIIVMITSAYFELSESKKEIFRLLSEQSSSLIKTISFSSINTLNSSYEIESLLTQRLLDNARLIRSLDSAKLITRAKLIRIGKENRLFRINIFDSRGNRFLTNRIPVPGHDHPEGKVNRYEELMPILTGRAQQLILGLHPAQHSEEERFAVAVARAFNKGAIVINLDAKDLLEFRKKIGIGKIINDIAGNRGIEYIVLQDSAGILAASSAVRSMDKIEGDPFLEKAMSLDSIFMRITRFNHHEVYEVVKRLVDDGDVIGIYRIGISLDDVKSVEARMYRRIVLISFLLAAFSVIILSIIFTSQNLKSISNEFSRFKTFTGTILQNMGEAVIVVDKDYSVTLFNNSAEELFKIKSGEVINKKLDEILGGLLSFLLAEIMKGDGETPDIQKDISVNGQTKFLRLSITKNINDLGQIENYTVVINDFTERKNLEEQAKRREKLSAMGELASGVAHEIRNPVNAIGMIAQRLNKEFSPEKDAEEYNSILKVLKDEVTRVNKIITQFLNYARPLDIQLRSVNAALFSEELYRLFIGQAEMKKIRLEKLASNSLEIKIDPELMKQALMNILQNALDAVSEGGKVSINYYKDGAGIVFEIKDTGSGISPDMEKKIFDLYYTTKKDGNGLGLSIAQKVVSQHNGTIECESEINKGTKFKIRIPIA